MRLKAAGLLAVLTVAAGATHASAPLRRVRGPSWTRESVAGGMRRSRTSSTGRLTRPVGGRPAKWCGWWLRTQGRRAGIQPGLELEPLGQRVGAPSAPSSCGRTTSASSPGGPRTGNGSSSQATTAGACASGRARSPAPCSASETRHRDGRAAARRRPLLCQPPPCVTITIHDTPKRPRPCRTAARRTSWRRHGPARPRPARRTAGRPRLRRAP